MQLSLGLGLPALRVAVLGSGSAGNALVIESGRDRLLIDAGFSCRELERRLERLGVDRSGFRGIVVTHEHSDHCQGARRFSRRQRAPVYATPGTLAELALGDDLPPPVAVRPGRSVEAGPFLIEFFTVPHDAREPVGVVIEDRSGRRVGVAADLGTCSQLAWARLIELDLLVLETNHDLGMLREGPYPWPLKERIASRHGHLSNREAAEGLPDLLNDRLRAVVLYHLSRTNNRPELAAERVAEVLAQEGSAAEVLLTDQFETTAWVEIEGDGAGA